MNTPAVLAAALLASAGTLTGCASGPTGSTRVSANDTDSQVTTQGLDLRDFQEAAAAVVQSMFNQGVFQQKYDEKGGTTYLIIDSFTNNTSRRIDPDEMFFKVTNEINQGSSLVRVAGSGPGARGKNEEACFIEPDKCADFFLFLKLIERRAADSRTRENSYLIQMELFDRDGFRMWGGEEVVIKQAAKRGIGF